MKKIIIFILLIINIIYSKSIFGYMDFVEYEIDTGKLLKEYTKTDYDKAYSLINNRKFIGWNTIEINSFKIRYIKEIVFVFTNDKGATPIEYKYTFNKQESYKKEINVSGNIKVDLNGTVKKFKTGLSSELKLSKKELEQTVTTEESVVNVLVDPGYTLSLVIFGEGEVQNGVGIKYLFYIEDERGGYEIFTKTCEYARLIKRRS